MLKSEMFPSISSTKQWTTRNSLKQVFLNVHLNFEVLSKSLVWFRSVSLLIDYFV